MKFLRDLPIKRKLMVITMLVSGIALAVACAAFMIYEQAAARKQMVQTLKITAAMTAANSTAGLSFDEAGSVEQVLKSLSAQSDIVQACVYDKGGRQFAHYLRADVQTNTPAPPVENAGCRFDHHRLELFQSIDLAGEMVGTIYLEQDLSQLTARLWRYFLIGILVLAVSVAVAFFLSSRLQKVISEPLSDLTKTVAVVRTGKDYSVRAAKQGDDELGSLIDGFNEMLAQIQERDANLERRVLERTRELAESQASYHSLVDQMPAGIFRKDKEGRYVFVSSWFCRLKGVKPENFLGKLPHEVTASTGGGSVEQGAESARLATAGTEHHATIMRTGGQIEFDEKSIGADGKVTYVHALKSPTYGPDGTVAGSQGILLDVTQRKLAETELAYERDLLRTLLENSMDHIYFKDAQSRFIKSSNSQARQFGVVSADELVGKSDFDFFQEDHAGPAFEDEQTIMRTGQPIIGKIERESWADGRKESWVLTTKMPFRNKAGEIAGTFGISKDITPIKEAEARLEMAHRQLLETSRMAGMAEVATSVLHNVGNVLNSVNVSTTLVLELVKKSRLNNLGRLAAMIHEEQNNLAAFFTTDPRGRQVPDYLTKLVAHLAAEQAELVAEIELTRKNVEHIKNIVMMQQSYAKVSGVVEKVKVTDLVEDALRMNAGALTRHDVQVVRDYPGEIVEGNLERQKVLQILVNLIRNAKYACDDSGRPDKRLTMQVRAGNGRAQIIVVDNGVGIPAENLTRIFNHGFTTRAQGHGFGLHSGALAAKELGGSLAASSDGPGTGARFVLDLPLEPPKKL